MDKYTIIIEDIETSKTIITYDYIAEGVAVYGELTRVIKLLRTLLPAVTPMHWYLQVKDPDGGLVDWYFWDEKDGDEDIVDEIKIDNDTVDALGQLRTLLDGQNGPQEPS